MNDSSNNRENIFGKWHSRKFTVTYHKISQDINLSDALNNFRDHIDRKIIIHKNSYRLASYIFQKEPYNLDNNPENKGLCHIHGLFIFEKKIRINSTKKFASLLSLCIGDQIFYPHISILHSDTAYVDYITKLHSEDAKYASSSYFFSSLEGKLIPTTAAEEIQNMVLKNPNITRKELSDMMRDIPLSRYSNRDMKLINFFINTIMYFPREINLHIKFDKETLKFLESDYNGNKAYAIIKEAIQEKLSVPSKSSLYITGEADTFKTSMVKAVCVAIADENKDKTYLLLCAYDIEDLKGITPAMCNEYNNVILLLDDIDMKPAYTRGEILQILKGNEGEGCTLPSRFENIRLPKNTIKVFIHNASFSHFISCIKKEMKARIKEINLRAM